VVRLDHLGRQFKTVEDQLLDIKAKGGIKDEVKDETVELVVNGVTETVEIKNRECIEVTFELFVSDAAANNKMVGRSYRVSRRMLINTVPAVVLHKTDKDGKLVACAFANLTTEYVKSRTKAQRKLCVPSCCCCCCCCCCCFNMSRVVVVVVAVVAAALI
jgi:hypothetical protein